MNREDRRIIEKRARRKGMSKSEAKSYAKTVSNADEIRKNGSGIVSPAKKFEDGDKVTLNIGRIQARKNYELMSDAYKDFVTSNEGTVFTAHVEKENVIQLEENTQWLFWSGDLDLAE